MSSTFTLHGANLDLLKINNKNQEVIFKITYDGDLYYKKDDLSELKKVECDSELALLFMSVIGDLTGSNFTNKKSCIELSQTITAMVI